MDTKRYKFIVLIIAVLVTGLFFGAELVQAVPSADEGEPADEEIVILGRDDVGDRVINVQQRLKDLGYFNYKVTGHYGSVTREAVQEFQRHHGLSADGSVGPETEGVLFSNEARIRPINERLNNINIPVSRGGRATVGEIIDWFNGGSRLFPRDGVALVTDVRTGISFSVRRTGGSNHADVEPLTREDTRRILRIYGGSWSWTRRAIIVQVGGRRIAASMHGMPHGYARISGNGMNGHLCIHFYRSRTHGASRLCPEHQRMVMIAAGR